MFNKIQADTVIATGFGGNAAFKDMFADSRVNTDAAVGNFNHQLAGIQLNQHFHRFVRQFGALRGFNRIIQQVADNRNQLRFN